MDIAPALAGVAAWGGVTALMLRCASAGADVIAPLFGSVAEPGWPHGVQEDDDFHWSWDRPKQTPAEDGDDSSGRPRATWRAAMTYGADQADGENLPMPEVIELPPGSGAPKTWPARPH